MLRPRLLSSLFVALLAGAYAGSLHAQRPSDYFAPRTPEKQEQLLSNEGHHLYKGIQHLNAGAVGTLNPVAVNRLRMAKGEFDFILGLWPNHPLALGFMSDTLIKLGSPQLIEPYFETAYSVSPTAARVYAVHGVSLLRRGDTKGAIAKLEQAVALDPASVDGHYNLGLAYLLAKNPEKANAHAQEAYALGHPLPGLRTQLQKAGAWKPLAPKSDAASGSGATQKEPAARAVGSEPPEPGKPPQ